MVAIDIVKFLEVSSILSVGDRVNAKMYAEYAYTDTHNLYQMEILAGSAYELEWIKSNGSRMKVSTAPKSPEQRPGFRIKMVSVFGEIESNEDGVIVLKKANINF